MCILQIRYKYKATGKAMAMEFDSEKMTLDEVSLAETYWAAGLVSVFGSFATVRIASQVPGKADNISAKLTVRSLTHYEAIEKLSQIAGMEAKTVKVGDGQGLQLVLTGKKLHAFMTKLWPALPKKRKQEYAAIRKAMKND